MLPPVVRLFGWWHILRMKRINFVPVEADNVGLMQVVKKIEIKAVRLGRSICEKRRYL